MKTRRFLTQMALSIGVAMIMSSMEWFMATSMAYRIWVYLGIGFVIAPLTIWAFPDK